jgi:hypothetical protein
VADLAEAAETLELAEDMAAVGDLNSNQFETSSFS